MMAAWIRIFEPEDPFAAPVYQMWADIITQSFRDGVFDEEISDKKCEPFIRMG